MRTLYAFFAVFVLWTIPTALFAQNTPLQNPLGTTDPRELIGLIINGALSISGSIALLMFIYGGILWLTAMGRSEPVEKGKRVLVWATLGIVLIASAYVISNAIFEALLASPAG